MCTYGMAAISSFELFISYTDHIETEMTVLGKGKKKYLIQYLCWNWQKAGLFMWYKILLYSIYPENER